MWPGSSAIGENRVILAKYSENMNTALISRFFLKLTLALAFLPMFAFSQTNVVPVGKGAPVSTKNGLIYALPRNVIKVELYVRKTDFFRGPYADFATKHLGLTSFINKNSTEYTIEGARLELLSETDPEQYYFIEMDGKSKHGGSLRFALNGNGIINAYSDQAKTSGKIQAGADGYSFADLLQPTVLEKVDTIIRKISVDTSTFKEVFVRRSVSERTIEQQAKETADQIRKLNDNKFSLITGYSEVNYSKEALEYMISQIEETRLDYLALFKGASRTSVSRHVFYVTPGNSPDGMLETICGFSSAQGITHRNAPGAEAVNLMVEPLQQINTVRDFVKQKEKPSREKRGIYYRIPEKAKITVKSGSRTVAEEDALISQMGIVTYLPAGIFSLVKLNPLTGGLELISSE